MAAPGGMTAGIYAPAEVFNDLVKSAAGQMAALSKTVATFSEQAFFVAAALKELYQVLSSTVRALAPGAFLAFEQVIRNLAATVGEALLPVLDALTDGIGMLAGFLLPVARMLGETFGKVAQIVMELLVSAFGGLAAVVRLVLALMLPFTNLVLAIIQGMQELFGTITVILTALVDTLADLVQMFLDFIQFKSLLKLINDTFRELAKTVLMVVATLAMFLGAVGFVDNMIKALTPGGGAQAAGQTSIKGVQDIAKDMALSAAMAGGSTAENEQKKWREDIAAALKDIRDQRPPRDFYELLTRVGGIVEKQLTKIGVFFETFWRNLEEKAIRPIIQKLGF